MIPFAVLHNRFKWLGLALVICGYALYAVQKPNLDSLRDGYGLSTQVLILVGFLTITCSRQKIEDEYVNHVRLVSLQWSVILLIFLRLAWKTIGYFTADESWMPHWQVNSLLQFYIIFFYYETFLRERLSGLFKTTR